MSNKHIKTHRVARAFDLEGSDFDLADATEVYGDWAEIDTPCDKSPAGQCEYDALRNPERCIHCGRKM